MPVIAADNADGNNRHGCRFPVETKRLQFPVVRRFYGCVCELPLVVLAAVIQFEVIEGQCPNFRC